jgi:hypothetical protein
LGGYAVRDSTGRAVAWVYARDTIAEAMPAKVLAKDEVCRITTALHAGYHSRAATGGTEQH